jgi:putative GTP pyrophosphokinase
MKHKSQQPFNAGEIHDQYKNCKDNYNKLGINLAQALELFLKERDIKVLSIDYRVKDDSSFAEKIDRKHYENPFDEIEDICGIRIICYYQSDVEKISEVLRQEFTVIENQDKETLLKADQFGYRSTHFIIKIKEEWNKAPNYRGLENLKAEIQIRTVLMHAWAEIEHKLVYKNANQIPTEYREEFAEIAALLKVSDKKFEKLRENITNVNNKASENVEKDEVGGVELNRQRLSTFLDKYSTKAVKNVQDSLNKLTLKEIVNDKLYLLEKKVEKKEDFYVIGTVRFQVQVHLVEQVLDLINPNYNIKSEYFVQYDKFINNYREIIVSDKTTQNSKENPN